MIAQFYERVLHVSTWPTVADLAFLSLYPCVGAGMVLLLRQRHHDKRGGSALDAVTVSVALALLCWIFLIRPLADEPSMSLLARLVTYAYPIGDFALLAILVRLLITTKRNVAVLCLTVGTLCFLVCDVAWSLINQTGYGVTSGASAALTAVPLVGYLLCCLAGLHPSAIRDGGYAALSTGRLGSNWMLAAWTLALLIAPVALLVEAAIGAVRDAMAIGVCAACLVLLVSFRVRQLVGILQHQSDRLRQLSHTDPLTNLLNRRGLHSVMPGLLEQARREHRPLGVLVIDIDHFKIFNDTYGHPMGDQLLVGAAAAWMSAVRPMDCIARLGGEEFVVVFPASVASDVLALDERLRALMPLGQTYSAGVAQWNFGEDFDELLVRADVAMYLAKERGRARTIVAHPPETTPDHSLVAPDHVNRARQVQPQAESG